MQYHGTRTSLEFNQLEVKTKGGWGCSRKRCIEKAAILMKFVSLHLKFVLLFLLLLVVLIKASDFIVC